MRGLGSQAKQVQNWEQAQEVRGVQDSSRLAVGRMAIGKGPGASIQVRK